MMRREMIAGGLVSLAAPALGLAQGFPSRPIRLVVTFPPGGTTDILARQLQPKMSEVFGQPVVVENRSGASGAIGTLEIVRAAPDGHTFGMVISTVISSTLISRQPYDAIRDLTPIQLLARVADILVVPVSSPLRTVSDLIEHAKRNPGLTYGSPGIGTSVHIAGAMFALAAGVEMVHVPYRGGGPALTDLISGHLQLMFGNASSTLPYVRDGALRPIAVTSAQRAPYLPDVPTIAEAGLPGVVIDEWYAFVGPAGIPQPIVERLNAGLNGIVTQPAERARLLDMGAEVVAGNAEEFGRFMRDEVEKIGRVVRAADIRME
ncbi:Bug family tripartite tricarboxylate transporter substrate binding protein [Roseococcus pinisoli]|uniref:Tripartite tricarboxylate transporter substrate binding protein n=1 Tax=Roseococcus pinisoli TaxID=2835040 RepID=A0ABS5QBW9_9PROT|nr:tripartite tricarboxylate transporter substrate binding protein [Roseococcus pinisoli]MBS7810923.1 tripartite tricarboxylate transporter substrate binding protein [Roseococcus pinisoli]